MLHQMQVKAIIPDQISKSPIVVLGGVEGDHELRIWIGSAEAHAIGLAMEGVDTPRPMTHDLLKTIIQQLDGTVVRIVVTELKNDTFYAVVELYHSGSTLVIDARPSDAIALAVRTNAPIFVDEEVLEAENARTGESTNVPARLEDVSAEEPAEKNWKEDPDSIKEWLDDISPDDFQ